LVDQYPKTQNNTSDWLLLYADDPLKEKGMLVKAQAGDMILWDSRTLHGGRVGTGEEV